MISADSVLAFNVNVNMDSNFILDFKFKIISRFTFELGLRFQR